MLDPSSRYSQFFTRTQSHGFEKSDVDDLVVQLMGGNSFDLDSSILAPLARFFGPREAAEAAADPSAGTDPVDASLEEEPTLPPAEEEQPTEEPEISYEPEELVIRYAPPPEPIICYGPPPNPIPVCGLTYGPEPEFEPMVFKEMPAIQPEEPIGDPIEEPVMEPAVEQNEFVLAEQYSLSDREMENLVYEIDMLSENWYRATGSSIPDAEIVSRFGPMQAELYFAQRQEPPNEDFWGSTEEPALEKTILIREETRFTPEYTGMLF